MTQSREDNDEVVQKIPRVSWGAILGGGLTALAISVILNLLGIGLGFTAINPVAESDPFSGLGTGTIIWWIVSNLIALFLGGMVAGRMAGFISKTDGGLHGFLSWCLYTVVLLFFITTTISSIIGGVTGTFSSVLGMGSDQQTVIQVNNQQQQQAQRQQGLPFNNIKNEFLQLIKQAEQYNILPGNTAEQVRETLNEGIADIQNMWQEQNLDRNIAEFFNDLSVNIDDGNLNISVDGEYINRQEIKDYLAQNTDLSEQEIEQRIDQWNQNIDQAITEVEDLYQKTKQQIEEFSAQLADTMATVSLVSFFVFLFGAIAAYGGGMMAAESNPAANEIEPMKRS